MTSLKDGEDFLRSCDKISIRALSSVPFCQSGAVCAPLPPNGTLYSLMTKMLICI